MKKRKFNIQYSSSPSYGSYNFLYDLKKKLNYAFKYCTSPKYGRYVFLYSLFDNLKIEEDDILLNRVDSSLDFREFIHHVLDRNNEYSSLIDSPEVKTNSVFKSINQVVLDSTSNLSRIMKEFVETNNSHEKLLFSDSSLGSGRKIYTLSDHVLASSTNKLIDSSFNDLILKNKVSLKSINQMISQDVYMKEKVEHLIALEFGIDSLKKESNGMFKENHDLITWNKSDKNSYIDDSQKNTFAAIDKKMANDKCDYLVTNSDSKIRLNEEEFTVSNADKTLKQHESETHLSKCAEKVHISDNELNPNSHNKIAKPFSEQVYDVQLSKIHNKEVELQEQTNLDKDLTAKLDGKPNEKQLSRTNSVGRVLNKERDEQLQSEKTLNNRPLDTDENIGLDRIASNELSQIDSMRVGQGYAGDMEILENIDINQFSENNSLVQQDTSRINKNCTHDVETQKTMDDFITEKRIVEEEIETRLDMHKRFWFIKSFGKVDYKILPSRDFSYPMSIDILDEKPDGIYEFEYESIIVPIKPIDNNFIVEIYNENYYQIDKFELGSFKDCDVIHNAIEVKIATDTFMTGDNISASIKITLKQDNLGYIIIRQPMDINGNTVLYTVTQKTIVEKHPIPFGNDLGLREIPIHIPIMVDFINILLLMWSKYYMAFTGYTGVQAIYGLVNVVHEWVTYETSLSERSIDDYHRCFRWLRWEAEQLYIKARIDPDLTGNAWIEELIFQLIDYMEMHHMNEVPEWSPISKMDEYRNMFDDPSFDIDVVTTKVKGVRKKVIEKHKRLKNNNRMEK